MTPKPPKTKTLSVLAVLIAASLTHCVTSGPEDEILDESEALSVNDGDDQEPARVAPIPEEEHEDDHIPATLPEFVDLEQEGEEFITLGYLAEGIERSDAVIYGEVVEIEHRSLHAHEEVDAPYPHTYVTYEVIEGFKGGRPGDRVTLRFLGGPTEDGTLVMQGSGIPTFDRGERDILFIRDNGAGPCPLLACEAGRLRVVDGLITTEGGRVVRLGEDTELRMGPLLDLDVVEHHDFFARERAPSEQILDRSELPERSLELSDLSGVLALMTAASDVELSVLSITPEHPLRARTPRND